MWMASASYEVEHSGSTMYNTPSILAQLGECDIRVTAYCQVRVFSIQPANSPDTKACISLRPVRPHTCRLGVLTKVEYLPRIGPFSNSQCPPRDAKIVMCAAREDDVLPRWRYASEDVNLYSRNSAHGHQLKGGWSCADGVWSIRDYTHRMCRRVSRRQHAGRRSQ